LAAVAKAQQERAKTLKEMAQNSTFFFIDPPWYEEKAAKKNFNEEGAKALGAVRSRLNALSEWSAASLHEAVNNVAAELQLGLGKIAQPIRVAVSGTSVSPPIDVTLEILGRETTLRRIDKAIAYAVGPTASSAQS
jgi:glutamyl-tRNA synthetase